MGLQIEILRFVMRYSHIISITTPDLIKRFKDNYNEIYANAPDTLIKIFPSGLNGKEMLYEFLTKEVAIAADSMLDKVQSIKEIKKEDKYSDIIVLALRSRVIPWGWHVFDQTRGAFSASKLGVGERDFIIKAFQTTLIVGEALNLKSKKVVQSHLKKVFNYHHNKAAFIMLIYYFGSKKFAEKWKEYREAIVPTVDFPDEYKMKDKKVSDLTSLFGYNASGIKIGKSNHGKETEIYHIFININYQT